MELTEYRKSRGVTWRVLADQIGIKHPNLHALAHGKKNCTMDVVRQIEDRTDGAVSANDITRVRRRFLQQKGASVRVHEGVAS